VFFFLRWLGFFPYHPVVLSLVFFWWGGGGRCSRKRKWVWFHVFTYGISMTVNWVWYKYRAAETNYISANSKKNRRCPMPMWLACAFAPTMNKWVISQYNAMHTRSVSIMGTPRVGAECMYAGHEADNAHAHYTSHRHLCPILCPSIVLGNRNLCSVRRVAWSTYRPEYPALTTSRGMPIVTARTQFRFSQNLTCAGPSGTKLLRRSGSVCILW
jgi:hypothetical protein